MDEKTEIPWTSTTTSPPQRRNGTRKVCVVGFCVCLLVVFNALFQLPLSLNTLPCSRFKSQSLEQRATRVLTKTPLIDGHNDLLIQIRGQFQNHIYSKNFTEPFEHESTFEQVDLTRMKKGQYAGAFWSAFYLCPSNISDFSDAAYAPIVRATFEAIDTFHRLMALYPNHFPTHPTTGPAEALSAFHNNRIISPLGIEGLHQIGNSVSTLRAYQALGVQYATLTWNCHNAYADAAVLTEISSDSMTTRVAEPHWHGLSARGRSLIREMNRLGMLIDLSHVSDDVMWEVLTGAHAHSLSLPTTDSWSGSLAPPIFSHSSARALCAHPRNVPDALLPVIKARGALVMINITPGFISCVPAPADTPSALPEPHEANNTLQQVVRHIVHIGSRIGYEHVGIGTDFDGMEGAPRGLEDVSKIPALVAEMLRVGISEADAGKIVGGNLLRIWEQVQKTGARLRREGMKPLEDEPGNPLEE